MRLILLAFAFTLPANLALAEKPEAPVCKPRFEGTYGNGTRAEADAPDEAAARRIFDDYAAKQNAKAPGKAADGKAAAKLKLDRVRRLADNCKGLQGFLVFN